MFIHQQNNTININNQVKLDVIQFRALEPNYPELPIGYNERYYEPNVRNDVMGADRILIREHCVWEDGDRYLSRIEDFLRLHAIVSAEQIAIDQAVNEELDKRKPYDELRRREYPNIEEMVIALWENLVEKQTKALSGVSDIQKKRTEIKKKYPKPEN
jgi:hypothetical protein